ncbi:hypothetical protein K8I61_13870 [bacterium]|nr:hypothetical protein [bacterium]
MANWYVSASSGSDANDGTFGNPKEHISAMLDALTYPLTEDTYVNCDGTVASPQAYTETGDELEIAGLAIQGDNELVIQADGFNNDNYKADANPYGATGTGAWDQSAAKPVIFDFEITVRNQAGLRFRGPQFGGNGTQLHVRAGADVYVDYSRFEGAASGLGIGAFVTGGGRLEINNSYFANHVFGVFGYDGVVQLIGTNTIENARRGAIYMNMRSLLRIAAWDENLARYLLYIYTDGPRNKYFGMRAVNASSIVIDDLDILPLNWPTPQVRIIDKLAQNSPGYFGVVANSKSLVSGVSNVIFRESGVNEFKDTIPAERQIVVAEGEDATVLP